MGKAKKEHRKKIQKRNEKIKQDQSRMEKLKRAFFQQIMKERESGVFNNNQPVVGVDGPNISEGPQI